MLAKREQLLSQLPSLLSLGFSTFGLCKPTLQVCSFYWLALASWNGDWWNMFIIASFYFSVLHLKRPLPFVEDVFMALEIRQEIGCCSVCVADGFIRLVLSMLFSIGLCWGTVGLFAVMIGVHAFFQSDALEQECNSSPFKSCRNLYGAEIFSLSIIDSVKIELQESCYISDAPFLLKSASWYLVPLQGTLPWIFGMTHSLIMLEVQGEDAIYVAQRYLDGGCEGTGVSIIRLEKCHNALQALDLLGFVQGNATCYVSLQSEHINDGVKRLSTRTLVDWACGLRQYDAIESNCHHMAQLFLRRLARLGVEIPAVPNMVLFNIARVLRARAWIRYEEGRIFFSSVVSQMTNESASLHMEVSLSGLPLPELDVEPDMQVDICQRVANVVQMWPAYPLPLGSLWSLFGEIRHAFHPFIERTVARAIDLVGIAEGGALLIVAPEFELERLDSQGIRFEATDQGYLQNRLSPKRICSDTFRKSFIEFTEHTSNDCWPNDHIDEAARGKPKDGAILVDESGNAWRSAVKLVGVPPAPLSWSGHGARHTTALNVAHFLDFAIVLVRSDSGSIHLLCKSCAHLKAFRLKAPFQNLEERKRWSGCCFGGMQKFSPFRIDDAKGCAMFFFRA